MADLTRNDRDSSTKFSLTELSSLLPYLREQVEEVQTGAGRAFDEALTKIRESGNPSLRWLIMAVILGLRWSCWCLRAGVECGLQGQRSSAGVDSWSGWQQRGKCSSF